VQGDPTEGALIVAAYKLGVTEHELARFPRIAEIPFTSERKRHTTVHLDRERPAELRIFVKGAPEVLLASCRYVWQDGRAMPLNEGHRAELAKRNDSLAAAALRTLAVATRTVPAAEFGLKLEGSVAMSRIEAVDSIEDELVLLGLVGMIDPPRVEARTAVINAKRAHIRTLMITGDHPATAAAIARELTIFEPGTRLVTGSQLRAMDDGELDTVVEQTRVFARVDPEHKLRIVHALQRQGHIVAMTGDGINDAPALKAADIGIAMGITGTDVSREAADMVLADDNFATIVKAIEEGRAIYDNIRKYLLYLLLTMMIGTLAVLDAYYPGGLFTLFATSSAPNAADEIHARTMAFTTLMMFQLYNAYNCRSSWRSALNGFFENKWLLGAVLLCLLAQLLVLQVPFLQTAFHTETLSPFDWAVVAGVAATLLAGTEIVKWVLRAKRRPARAVVPRVD
jgi:P-type Ca2+ transporter type 2C